MPNSHLLAGAAARKLLRTGRATDLGLVGAANEDAYAALPGLGLWLVADGMEGMVRAGGLASAIAVTVVVQQARNGATLAEAIQAAHRAIRDVRRRGLGQRRDVQQAVLES